MLAVSKKIIGQIEKEKIYTAANIILQNFTDYHVILDKIATSCTGVSKSDIIDNGFNNQIFNVKVK